MRCSFTSYTTRMSRTSWIGPSLHHNCAQILSVDNEMQFHQLNDSYESHQLTKDLPYSDTQILSLYNDIQLHQLLLYIISLKCITFTTWKLVQLVRVAPLQSSISRLEQVVSIGQSSGPEVRSHFPAGSTLVLDTYCFLRCRRALSAVKATRSTCNFFEKYWGPASVLGLNNVPLLPDRSDQG